MAAFALLTAFAFVACTKKEEPKAAAADSTATAMSHEAMPAERGLATASFGSDSVSIDYGRPQLKGRDMLAQATEGMVWRMGMNEATEIKTTADLKFGETSIPKGSYSLWMKKITGDQWHLVFNKKTGIWGTDRTPEDDFAEVPMTIATNPESVETFTVELSAADATNGTIKATWGTAILSANFVVTQSSAM